jgi:hypothetical protein
MRRSFRCWILLRRGRAGLDRAALAGRWAAERGISLLVGCVRGSAAVGDIPLGPAVHGSVCKLFLLAVHGSVSRGFLVSPANVFVESDAQTRTENPPGVRVVDRRLPARRLNSQVPVVATVVNCRRLLPLFDLVFLCLLLRRTCDETVAVSRPRRSLLLLRTPQA